MFQNCGWINSIWSLLDSIIADLISRLTYGRVEDVCHLLKASFWSHCSMFFTTHVSVTADEYVLHGCCLMCSSSSSKNIGHYSRPGWRHRNLVVYRVLQTLQLTSFSFLKGGSALKSASFRDSKPTSDRTDTETHDGRRREAKTIIFYVVESKKKTLQLPFNSWTNIWVSPNSTDSTAATPVAIDLSMCALDDRKSRS